MVRKASRTTKFVFVTGGVLSGLGKGITAASLGALFESRGYSVNIQKLDPYLNVDAGTLNPAEHGECFVTDDGAETDLDLGHYERFLDVNLTQSSSVMSGRILSKLIADERAGKYLGKTVQVVPHFTRAVEKEVLKAAKGFDIHIVEIGGTVGDYESPAFFEALRELTSTLGRGRVANVQLVFLPYLNTSSETKTKPAQNAVRSLRALGLMPDVLLARSRYVPPKSVIDKLSQMSGVERKGVALLNDADTIYRVPLMLHEQRIDSYILRKLGLPTPKAELLSWQDLVAEATSKHSKKRKIGLVAKYMDNEDTYFSVIEALRAASWAQKTDLDIEWVDSEKLTTKNVTQKLSKYSGLVVPGGFGSRGIEGKVLAAQYALKTKTPYLGLCLGLQVAVIALARSALGLKNANTTEIDEETEHPVIYIMPQQRGKQGTGGTMRLGSYPCKLKAGTLTRKLYGTTLVNERHRHRYEVNNDYLKDLQNAGMVVSGKWEEENLVEIIEIKNHPYFIASQFHPEFKSRPMRPHPLFSGFITSLQKR